MDLHCLERHCLEQRVNNRWEISYRITVSNLNWACLGFAKFLFLQKSMCHDFAAKF